MIDLGRFAKFFQFLPRILTTNPTSPLSIFSIVTYLIMWISLMIVFFRHNSKFGDEEGDPVNATFTAIGILMFILLLIKETSLGAKVINALMYIFNQPLSTILLHASIITTLIVSIYFTTKYLESNALNGINKQIVVGILVLNIFLWILLIIYLPIIIYSYSKAVKYNYY
jgi:hypothetical protein